MSAFDRRVQDNAMKMIFTLMLALMSVAFLFEQARAQMGQFQENVPVSIKELRDAPTEIVLDGRSLSLSAYLWRNFMPGNRDSSLMMGLKVATSDKQAFPSGVRLDRAWVLFGEQIWEVLPFRGRFKDFPNKEGWIKCSDSPVCEVPSVRGGPTWSRGALVDVVLRLIDREGKHHLIQAQKQHINAAN